jgi:uncharacterized RDD family membrane protein YckC
MDIRTTKNEEKVPDIKFNIDDFDLENYDFEPLTEGLGFNNQNRKRENIVVKKQAETKVQPVITPKPVLRKEDFEKRAQTKSVSTSGLSSFYQDSKLEKQVQKSQTTIKPSPRVNVTKRSLAEAEVEVKFVAWIIDFITISVLFAATIAAAAFIVSIPLTLETVNRIPNEVYFYLAVIYTCFYLFYFTIFDLQKTFGKLVMGIKTVGTNDEPITIRQSFIRSFIGLASLLLLGFPLVLDFQGKLSDTKVCTN